MHPSLENKSYVKINMGCGTKIFPKSEGWINVDLNDNPDVDIRADVRTVSNVLGNNIADEIHAYNLVPYIFPQEITYVFANWNQMLKPGGKIALEMPCFLKCAKNLLQFDTTNVADLWYELGLKGLFGDYRPVKVPEISEMVKTAWTYKTIRAELERVGFINIEEQTPVTNRPERDFRIVGYKHR